MAANASTGRQNVPRNMCISLAVAGTLGVALVYGYKRYRREDKTSSQTPDAAQHGSVVPASLKEKTSQRDEGREKEALNPSDVSSDTSRRRSISVERVEQTVPVPERKHIDIAIDREHSGEKDGEPTVTDEEGIATDSSAKEKLLETQTECNDAVTPASESDYHEQVSTEDAQTTNEPKEEDTVNANQQPDVEHNEPTSSTDEAQREPADGMEEQATASGESEEKGGDMAGYSPPGDAGVGTSSVTSEAQSEDKEENSDRRSELEIESSDITMKTSDQTSPEVQDIGNCNEVHNDEKFGEKSKYENDHEHQMSTSEDSKPNICDEMEAEEQHRDNPREIVEGASVESNDVSSIQYCQTHVETVEVDKGGDDTPQCSLQSEDSQDSDRQQENDLNIPEPSLPRLASDVGGEDEKGVVQSLTVDIAKNAQEDCSQDENEDSPRTIGSNSIEILTNSEDNSPTGEQRTEEDVGGAAFHHQLHEESGEYLHTHTHDSEEKSCNSKSSDDIDVLEKNSSDDSIVFVEHLDVEEHESEESLEITIADPGDKDRALQFGASLISHAHEDHTKMHRVSVQEDSLAFRCGLRSGDCILHLNGMRTEEWSSSFLQKIIHEIEVEQFTIIVERSNTKDTEGSKEYLSLTCRLRTSDKGVEVAGEEVQMTDLPNRNTKHSPKSLSPQGRTLWSPFDGEALKLNEENKPALQLGTQGVLSIDKFVGTEDSEVLEYAMLSTTSDGIIKYLTALGRCKLAMLECDGRDGPISSSDPRLFIIHNMSNTKMEIESLALEHSREHAEHLMVCATDGKLAVGRQTQDGHMDMQLMFH